MSKVIKHVKARGMGHLELQFEDGSQEVVTRGNHEQHALKAGDVWPKPSADLDRIDAILQEDEPTNGVIGRLVGFEDGTEPLTEEVKAEIYKEYVQPVIELMKTQIEESNAAPDTLPSAADLDAVAAENEEK